MEGFLLGYGLPAMAAGGGSSDEKTDFGSRGFRVSFLPHGDAREAATGLEMQLGERPIERDRSGSERRPDDGGRSARNFDRERGRERERKREKREKKKRNWAWTQNKARSNTTYTHFPKFNTPK
ncbi:hypothetical protein ACLB2K_072594 [Fragaria x ananassa]